MMLDGKTLVKSDGTELGKASSGSKDRGLWTRTRRCDRSNRTHAPYAIALQIFFFLFSNVASATISTRCVLIGVC